MQWYVRVFLKSSLAWLAAGVTLGLAMAIHAPWAIYRTAHLHMNVLGFVAMMIFGVGYHVIPRFAGHGLWSERLAGWHVWLANLGLAVMAVGFALRAANLGSIVLAVGGTLSAAGAYAFAFNIWRTIDLGSVKRAQNLVLVKRGPVKSA